MMERELKREPSKESLPTQTWLAEFLGQMGFRSTGPGIFSNGRASVRAGATQVIADPGTGDTTWTCQLKPGNREDVERFLEQTLGEEPFWSEQRLARERLKRRGLQRALAGISAALRQHPESPSASELRRFLASLQSRRHTVNLARLAAALDAKQAGWVAQVFAAVVIGQVQPDDIARALADAGETGTPGGGTLIAQTTEEEGPGRPEDSDKSRKPLGHSTDGPGNCGETPST